MRQTVHDGNTRKDADVTKKGYGPAVPNQQWEKIMNLTPAGNDLNEETCWNPMPSKMRPRTHKKINECDY